LATEQKMTGGAYNIALNTILTYCGWFRMVPFSLIAGGRVCSRYYRK
jgi:hypothetical protein